MPPVHVVLIVGFAVFVGGFVQASVGFGVGLIAGPVAAMLDPQLMPEAMLIPSIASTLRMCINEWKHVDFKGLRWAGFGMIPGAASGAYIVTILSAERLSFIVALAVLLIVALSVLSFDVPKTRMSLACGGAVSGLSLTATGLGGGPPMALLYQREHGPRIRASLAAFFLVTMTISLTFLSALGEVSNDGIFVGTFAIPFVLVGYVLATPLKKILNQRLMRMGVLLVASLGALSLIARFLA